MSDDGTFTWKARTRGCQCCKWKDERIAELEAKLHWYQTAFNPPLVKPPKNLVKEAEQ